MPTMHVIWSVPWDSRWGMDIFWRCPCLRLAKLLWYMSCATNTAFLHLLALLVRAWAFCDCHIFWIRFLINWIFTAENIYCALKYCISQVLTGFVFQPELFIRINLYVEGQSSLLHCWMGETLHPAGGQIHCPECEYISSSPKFVLSFMWGHYVKCSRVSGTTG